MDNQKKETGFSTLELLLVIIIVGLITLVGWFIYKNHRKPPLTPTQASNNTSVKPSPNNVSKIPDGMLEYKNKDLGFKFDYPKEWGSVTRNSYSDPKLLYAGTFDKNNKVSFAIAAKDYSLPKTLGDAGCSQQGFGLFNFLELNNTAPNYYYNRELLRTSDRHIIEAYKTGYCAGNTLLGRVKLGLSQSNGIDVTYFDQKSDEAYGNMTIPEYMKDKINLIPATLENQFSEVVKSVQVIQ